MVLRISFNFILLLSILFSTWWFTFFLVVVGVFLFKNFYEAIFAGLLIDLLYGVVAEEFYGIWFVFTASFLILFLLVERFKKNIRVYESI